MRTYILNLIIFVLCVVFLFTGCDIDEGRDETLGMGIYQAHILSISKDRPATVMIGAIGSHSNTCVNINGTVYAELQGNTIQLNGTYEGCHFGCTCGDLITEVYGEVIVKGLEVGEYKVVSGRQELLQFRIEDDAGYIIMRPIIQPYLIPYTEPSFPTDTPVTLQVSGYFRSECKPYLKTEIIERYPGAKASTIEIVVVDLYGEVPIDANCLPIINPYEIGNNPQYIDEIELGTFSTIGTYKVVVNGENYYFTIQS